MYTSLNPTIFCTVEKYMLGLDRKQQQDTYFLKNMANKYGGSDVNLK